MSLALRNIAQLQQWNVMMRMSQQDVCILSLAYDIINICDLNRRIYRKAAYTIVQLVHIYRDPILQSNRVSY
jgi:hypothetical protein